MSLKEPGTTRDDVIASLGTPLVDFPKWAPLIAYDERGLIVAQEDCFIETEPLEKACMGWNERRRKSSNSN